MAVDIGLHHLVEGHMVVPLLIFLRNSMLTSTVAAQFTVPPIVNEGSIFSTLSLALVFLIIMFCFVFFFDEGHSSMCVK